MSNKKTPVALAVAQSSNRVIGMDNKLPWHIPEDLMHFKEITVGKPIVMGRKTYDTIGRPLPGRTNIVVTRQSGWRAEGVSVVNSLDEAIAVASAEDPGEVMVIGGAQIYELMLPVADRVYLTEVDIEIEGDAWFPELPENEWREVSRKVPEVTADPAYAFVCLERI